MVFMDSADSEINSAIERAAELILSAFQGAWRSVD
jgi:hypothetical protein